MAKTITRPKLAPRRPADFEVAPAPVQPEEKAVSKSRSEVEVWNATFPRRAWLDGEATTQSESPQVRPAGHERGQGAPQEAPASVSQILTQIERAYVAPADIPGLCRNCARLSDCTYPKPAGGVWHCDEYE
jgi:hypothetical protein